MELDKSYKVRVTPDIQKKQDMVKAAAELQQANLLLDEFIRSV